MSLGNTDQGYSIESEISDYLFPLRQEEEKKHIINNNNDDNI